MLQVRSISDVESDFLSKKIPKKSLCKLTDMGHLKEVLYVQKLNKNGFPIKKISKDDYVVLDTGEIGQYKHGTSRIDNVDSLRKTFRHIRYLINTNFVGADNELMFTLTYKDNMQDTKKLYSDFKKFMLKINYKYKDVDYINIVEPQGRGAWHCHVLLRFNQQVKVYIPNKDIADMWGNGFVTVRGIKKDVDNIGAYISAYLGDIPLDDSESINELFNKGVRHLGDVKTALVDGKEKKFIKGARLYLYPTGMNIYRKSKGIVEPTSEYKEYSDIKKIVGDATPTYSKKYDVLDNDNECVNQIIYEQYNLKRN